MAPCSIAERDHIIALLKSGHSTYQIHDITGHHWSTVSHLQSIYCPDITKSSGGCPQKLSQANVQHAICLISSRKADNAIEVTRSLRDITNTPLSAQTTHCYLKSAGMKAVVKKKKPLLSKKHRKACLDYALAHRDWTMEDWKKVVWSDETKINRLGSDGKKWVWKKAGEGLSDCLVEGTLKFGGGSVMLWGCMLWDGIGYVCKIDGRMDGDLYVSIMEDELQSTLEFYGKTQEDIIFQQDNDPKHTCKQAQDWFSNNNFQVMKWPAQSPDLNPIEHCWDHLKRKLGDYEAPPGGMLELWDRIQKEWDAIPKEVCQNLISSMPRRVAAVIKAKGGYTKY
ncbi:hypothetical protein FRC17_001580 [Serendipita sp. 399]|nr:hypothetical protein FRC17_001580 [Serendipita sp. 399]